MAQIVIQIIKNTCQLVIIKTNYICSFINLYINISIVVYNVVLDSVNFSGFISKQTYII